MIRVEASGGEMMRVESFKHHNTTELLSRFSTKVSVNGSI